MFKKISQVLIFTLPVFLFCYAWFIVIVSLPKLDGVTTVRSLNKMVTIKYDDNGVPYIEAFNLEDLFLTQGFVQASHRIFQMDILRRLSCGRLSQILGQTTLNTDKFNTMLDLENKAKLEYEGLKPEYKSYLDAFANGVNAYLANNFEKLPIEFKLLNYRPKPWTPMDSIAILEYLNFQSNNNFDYINLQNKIINKLSPNDYNDLVDSSSINNNDISLWRNFKIFDESINNISDVFKITSPQTLTGSNAFVVAGQKSNSNGGLMATAKHEKFTNPSLWFLNSLNTPAFSMAGASIPGVPGLVIGRNNNLAFTFVDLKTNSHKFVLEKFAPKLSNYYLSRSGYLKTTTVKNTIPVRFKSDYVFNYDITRDGPVINRQQDFGIVLAYPSDLTGEMASNFSLNLSSNIKEADTALANYQGSPRQYYVVDKEKNARSYISGYLTKSNLSDTKNFIDGSNLPKPYFELQSQTKLQPKNIFDYSVSLINLPLVLTNNLKPCESIKRELALKFRRNIKLGLPDLNDIESSAYDLNARKLISHIAQILNNANICDKFVLETLPGLTNYDGNVNGSSLTSLIYQSFLQEAAEKLLLPKLGSKLLYQYQELCPDWTTRLINIVEKNKRSWLPQNYTSYNSFLVSIYIDTITKLRVIYPDFDKAQWQDKHEVNFIYFLSDLIFKNNNFSLPFINFGPFKIGFDNDSARMINVLANGKKVYAFSGSIGSVFTFMLDMNNASKIYYTLAPGQSAQILSDYNFNLINSWIETKPRVMYFDLNELNQNISHKLILTSR